MIKLLHMIWKFSLQYVVKSKMLNVQKAGASWLDPQAPHPNLHCLCHPHTPAQILDLKETLSVHELAYRLDVRHIKMKLPNFHVLLN